MVDEGELLVVEAARLQRDEPLTLLQLHGLTLLRLKELKSHLLLKGFWRLFLGLGLVLSLGMKRWDLGSFKRFRLSSISLEGNPTIP